MEYSNVYDEIHKSHILSNLGFNIKSIRLRKGIRQNEIAYRCNFDKSSFNNIEKGKRNITIINLCKISEALNEPLENLLEGITIIEK